MCSWCWGFSPVIAAVAAHYGPKLPIRLIMGGLRPGTTEPMSARMAAEIREHWRHVAEASGQPFDLAFFEREGFVYDTEPACRAVAWVADHAPALAMPFLARVQRAFYAENRDVTRLETLVTIGEEAGFDRAVFAADLASEAAIANVREHFLISRGAGVTGFPTLAAGMADERPYALITQGFQPGEAIFARIERWLELNASPST
jgi:putative protein-disulfide isomerase